MNHRLRSRAAGVAGSLALVAVVAVAAGLVVGGWALAVAAVVAATCSVGAAVLAVRLQRSSRAALADQRTRLDAELDRRLDQAHRTHDAVTATLRRRLTQSERDQGQLELALGMALVRRDGDQARRPGSDVDRVDGHGLRRDVESVGLDRAS